MNASGTGKNTFITFTKTHGVRDAILLRRDTAREHLERARAARKELHAETLAARKKLDEWRKPDDVGS